MALCASPFGCLVLRVRLPVRPNGKPWPIDDFRCARSSAILPTTLVVSLSGVDRSRYLLIPRFGRAGTGGAPGFVRLVET